MDPALRQKLDALPTEPGCYLMKDRSGAVVYVGKAQSLRARVRSYFDLSGGQAPALRSGRGDDRAFVALLDDLLGDLDVIVTRSEKEAVLLENELIKKHRPRFNVRLRDDKDFIVLRLDQLHPYPRLEVRRARQKRDDGARYFGPYSSASSIRETLRIVNRWFQLRTCTDHVFDHRKRPCILYQIHRCPAPCVYEIPPEEYRQSVEDAVEFLEGREGELTERLRRRMAEAAEALRFEDAARLRDQLVAVERSLEKQRVDFTAWADDADRDVFGVYREGPDLVIAVLSMRRGKLQDARTYPFRQQEFPVEETLSSFLTLYYEQNPAPEEVLLPMELEGAWALAEVLSDRRGPPLTSSRRVKLLTPQRGAKADLLEVAGRNAEQGFKSWQEKDERREEALAAITRALHLAKEPRWMECYDISTFQGALAVGSGVSMKDGELDRANYRRYKVKAVSGQDDFAMLHEVLTRRLRRAVAEGCFPDLLVIDGGKGQLNAALAAAHDLGVPTKPALGNEGAPFVEMVGLAKSRLLDYGTARVISGRRRGSRSGPPGWSSGAAAWMESSRSLPDEAAAGAAPGGPRVGTRGEAGVPGEGAAAELADAADVAHRGFIPELERTPERVFVPGRKDPVVLRQNSAELFLVTRLRDEAHRFAITFHRKLRRSRNFQSVLEEIPGVGPGRRKALLRALGSLKRIKEASLEEISRVEGFGPAAAKAVWDFFHPVGGAPAAVVVAPEDPEPASGGDGVTEAEIDRALEEEEGGEGEAQG